jgi:cytochrome oxidase Cu insertion factor (SCO1/SenC/PrrC family)
VVSALLKSRLVVFSGLLIVGLGVVGGGLWYVLGSRMGPGAAATVPIGGPFTLTDQHGETVTERDFAGRWMLVYFGYTYCPDVCPLSLMNMGLALDMLEQDEAEHVVPVFITVDPERDTVEQLASYAPSFHPRLVALTGTPTQVRDAAKAYRVYFAKAEGEDTTDYLMDHSGFIYLMGPDGTYRSHFSHTTSPEAMAEGLKAALAEG